MILTSEEKTPEKGDLRYRETPEYKYHSEVWDKKIKGYVSVYTRHYPQVLEQYDGTKWNKVPEAFSWD